VNYDHKETKFMADKSGKGLNKLEELKRKQEQIPDSYTQGWLSSKILII
jgi:hypothetical protein